MKCTYCGTELGAGVAFCRICGTKAPEEPKSCPSCGWPLSQGAAFCRHCGIRLTPEAGAEKVLPGGSVLTPKAPGPVPPPPAPKSPVPAPSAIPRDTAAPAPNPEKPRAAWIAGIAIGVALMGGLVFFLFFNKNSEGDERAPETMGGNVVQHTAAPEAAPRDDRDEERDSAPASAAPEETPEPAPSESPETPTPAALQSYGEDTSACNVANGGMFSAYGQWIYYRGGRFMESSGSSYGVYRITDGAAPERVTSLPNWDMSVDETSLYFFDHKDGNALIKVDVESGAATYLSRKSVSTCLALGDYVYFSSKNGFFRVSKDGSDAERIADYQVRSISRWNSAVFFIRSSTNRLMMIDESTLGTPAEMPLKTAMHYAVASDGFLYFTERASRVGGRLFRCDLQGGKTTPLVQSDVNEFTMDADSIYYVSRSDERIYSVPKDGGQASRVSPIRALHLCYVNGWLYFVNKDNDTSQSNDEYILWRMRPDGSESEALTW